MEKTVEYKPDGSSDPDNLSQGNSNAVGDLAFTASAGATATWDLHK